MTMNMSTNTLETLRVDPTFDTPEIFLDAESGVFRITGNSYPADPMPVYLPVVEWFRKYVEHPLQVTAIEFRYTYFSTTSTQLIFEIFRMLEEIYKNGYAVKVSWYYSGDNEEIRENGEDFSGLFDIPFEVIEL